VGHPRREPRAAVAGELQHVFDVYMSPGSVTERLHFYAASYTPASRTDSGGGAIAEGKTIMLLHWAALEGPFA
jgi:hypothetical protein